jgi:hypothetical protein
MEKMGLDKLQPAFKNKKDVYSDSSNIRIATESKATLVKISSVEIKAKRIAAYKYLLP